MSIVTFRPLSFLEQKDCAERKEVCLFCDKELITNIFLNTTFGHACEGSPGLIHCYHKVCLQKTAAYCSFKQIAEPCCIGCTRGIENIGIFLHPSRLDKAVNTVRLVFNYENANAIFPCPVDGSWNYTHDALALAMGAFMGAVAGTSKALVKEETNEAFYAEALSGAVNGALYGIGVRVASLSAASLVTVLAGDKAGTAAAMGAGIQRSKIGIFINACAGGVIGSFKSGAIAGGTAVLLSTLFNKMIDHLD